MFTTVRSHESCHRGCFGATVSTRSGTLLVFEGFEPSLDLNKLPNSGILTDRKEQRPNEKNRRIEGCSLSRLAERDARASDAYGRLYLSAYCQFLRSFFQQYWCFFWKDVYGINRGDLKTVWVDDGFREFKYA